MTSFTNFDSKLKIIPHLEASIIFEQEYYVVTEPFVYELGFVGSKQYVAIPTGFLTDGASVPPPFNKILKPWGDYGQAAALHDYLCDYGDIIDHGVHKTITRKQTDHIFKEAMSVLGVNPFKKNLMAGAVNMYRIFSGTHAPTFPTGKREVESMILNNWHKRGDFKLSVSQSILLKKQIEEKKHGKSKSTK